MKERSLVIGLIVSIVIIIMVAVILTIVGPNIKVKKKPVAQNVVIQNEPIVEKKDEEPLVATLERKEQEDDEAPQIRDAATITQEIQEMDTSIGVLIIPKTELYTEVYCKQDANKMEEMPCMLYTNEGPNKQGVTILVGHNRENGTLFSNNNMLEENDELYFIDLEGEEKKYIVYSKFITNNDDVSFYNSQVDGPVIAMQCCLTPTDTENVLIIMAKAEN